MQVFKSYQSGLTSDRIFDFLLFLAERRTRVIFNLTYESELNFWWVNEMLGFYFDSRWSWKCFKLRRALRWGGIGWKQWRRKAEGTALEIDKFFNQFNLSKIWSREERFLNKSSDLPEKKNHLINSSIILNLKIVKYEFFPINLIPKKLWFRQCSGTFYSFIFCSTSTKKGSVSIFHIICDNFNIFNRYLAPNWRSKNLLEK